jgi:hypothetical protein
MRDTCGLGAGRLGAPLSFARALCPRRIAPRPKLPRGAPGAVADDEGGRLVIIRVVGDERSPEVSLIAFRATLDTLERHMRLLFVSYGRPRGSP